MRPGIQMKGFRLPSHWDSGPDDSVPTMPPMGNALISKPAVSREMFSLSME